jgi:quinol monooxygenase YgiN
MDHTYYTLASWRVRPGHGNEFLRIWRDELATAFLDISAVARGTLIQSLEDPGLFYSFGPWESIEEMQQARTDPRVSEAIDKLESLCREAKPGPFRVVLTMP